MKRLAIVILCLLVPVGTAWAFSGANLMPRGNMAVNEAGYAVLERRSMQTSDAGNPLPQAVLTAYDTTGAMVWERDLAEFSDLMPAFRMMSTNDLLYAFLPRPEPPVIGSEPPPFPPQNPGENRPRDSQGTPQDAPQGPPQDNGNAGNENRPPERVFPPENKVVTFICIDTLTGQTKWSLDVEGRPGAVRPANDGLWYVQYTRFTETTVQDRLAAVSAAGAYLWDVVTGERDLPTPPPSPGIPETVETRPANGKRNQ
jgi:outer membrane protein assembly factor BamB